MLHEIRMVEPIEDDLEVMPLEAFNKAVEAIKKKQGKLDFFKKLERLFIQPFGIYFLLFGKPKTSQVNGLNKL